MLWLITALYGYERDERDAFVRACARRERPPGVPPEVAAILTRHAPLAAVMTDFYRRLQRESRRTPYPVDEIRRIGRLDGWSIAGHRPGQ